MDKDSGNFLKFQGILILKLYIPVPLAFLFLPSFLLFSFVSPEYGQDDVVSLSPSFSGVSYSVFMTLYCAVY